MKRRLIAASVGVILALLLLEIGLRLFLPLPAVQATRGMYIADPELAFRMRPGFLVGGEPLNSRGFRGPEWIPAGPRRRRIAAFGDSFTFGLGLEKYRASWPAQMEAALAGAGMPAEALNFGTSSYSTVQCRRLYLSERGRSLAAMQPDVILLGFYLGNDVHDNATGNLGTQVIDGNLATYRPSWVRRRLDPLFSRFAVYAWGRIAFRQVRALWQRRITAEEAHAAAETDAFAMLRSELQERDPWSRGWSVTEETLAAWRADAAEDSRALIVVMFPDQVQVDRARQAAVASALGLRAEDYDTMLPNRRLAEALERVGIPWIDVTPAFQAAPNLPALYLPNDGHFSEEGSRLAGEVIARSLMAAAPVVSGNITTRSSTTSR